MEIWLARFCIEIQLHCIKRIRRGPLRRNTGDLRHLVEVETQENLMETTDSLPLSDEAWTKAFQKFEELIATVLDQRDLLSFPTDAISGDHSGCAIDR